MKSEQIMKALAACIEAAPEKERNELAQAIEDYAAKYGRSWKRLRDPGQPAFFKTIIDTVVEAADARPKE